MGYEKYEFLAKYKWKKFMINTNTIYEYCSVRENHPNGRTNSIRFEQKKSPEYKYEYEY